jgi:hypothetical protein
VGYGWFYIQLLESPYDSRGDIENPDGEADQPYLIRQRFADLRSCCRPNIPAPSFSISEAAIFCSHILSVQFQCLIEPSRLHEMDNKQFPEVQGGGSLILGWQIRNKRVLVIGGGEVGAQSPSLAVGR